MRRGTHVPESAERRERTPTDQQTMLSDTRRTGRPAQFLHASERAMRRAAILGPILKRFLCFLYLNVVSPRSLHQTFREAVVLWERGWYRSSFSDFQLSVVGSRDLKNAPKWYVWTYSICDCSWWPLSWADGPTSTVTTYSTAPTSQVTSYSTGDIRPADRKWITSVNRVGEVRGGIYVIGLCYIVSSIADYCRTLSNEADADLKVSRLVRDSTSFLDGFVYYPAQAQPVRPSSTFAAADRK